MKWVEKLWIVMVVLALATCVFATDKDPLYCQDPYSGGWYVCGQTSSAVGDNGLPLEPTNETTFYAMNYQTKKFAAVANAQQDDHHFYVRFDFGYSRWIWVTGHDGRPVTVNSKVQGKRLGVPVTDTDKRGLDWYQLQADWAQWKRVTDLKPPTVYRREWDGSIVVGEQPPDNWQTLGGQLDGQQPALGKPTCKLVPNPPTVKAGQPLLLHLSLDGQVTGATITGLKVNLIQEHGNNYAELMLLPTTPGFFTAAATISGPGGDAACDVNYAVDPPDPKKTKF